MSDIMNVCYAEPRRGEWTAKWVRELLPSVPLKIGRRTFDARVMGRKNPFATVSVTFLEHGDREYLRGLPWIDFEYSWETIADALNNGSVLHPYE